MSRTTGGPAVPATNSAFQARKQAGHGRHSARPSRFSRAAQLTPQLASTSLLEMVSGIACERSSSGDSLNGADRIRVKIGCLERLDILLSVDHPSADFQIPRSP